MNKILILHNSAPGYSDYFIRLGSILKNKGFSVIHAFSSECEYEKNKQYIEDEYYILKTVKSEDIVNKYSHYNLNNALFSDVERATYYSTGFNWSYKDDVDLLKSSLLSFFEEIISKHKVDYVLYENVSNSFAYYSWFVCQELGVRYVGLIQSRLPRRFSITSTPLCGCEEMMSSYSLQQNESIKKEPYIDIYLDKFENIQPDYMKTNNLSQMNIFKKYKYKGIVDKIKLLVLSTYNSCQGSYQLKNYFNYYWSIFFRDFKRAYKFKWLSSFYDNPAISEEYYLYPLHFHPESSTSILASNFVDELQVIKSIAYNLPSGACLFVKDHPSAAGYPSLKFYKDLSKIHNVKLIRPEYDTKNLIKNALAIVTLTSTVGYEALLLGKKVFLYGRVFYECHANVYKVSLSGDLYEIFSDLSLNITGKSLVDYNYSFLCAYYKSTSEGLFNIKDLETAQVVANSLAIELLKK